jgi:peptide-methionine (S)-S-oxide reductase
VQLRGCLAVALCLAGSLAWAPALAESAVVLPPPAADSPATADGLETAVLAGGCFWGIQAVFQHVKGVREVLDGYSGGTTASPSYEEVSSGATGHAESVRIRFDPHEVTYGQLLQVFFSVAHDPTQLNRQGPDWGTQYRSAIFYANQTQERIARQYVEQLDKADAFPAPIVTELAPMKAFYPAEAYHQDYALKHPDSAYIVINDLPKVENLERLFPELYRATPATVAAAGG